LSYELGLASGLLNKNDNPMNSPALSSHAPSITDHDADERLACPDCQVPLWNASGKLTCPTCRQAWPLVDGIPHFVSDFPYWGEIPQDQMREVNRLAQSANWKKVLLESPEPSVRAASTMILNLDRANWHYLADLTPDSRVLDLGAGTGTTSHALAKHCREVVAVEPVLERVQFMQQRFAQEGIANVRVVRSSLWTLPFAPGSFDLVAMNGVLEWVAQGVDGDPEELQERALKNALRLLRPGGYLYVGIENRLGLGYFVGYPDPHAGIPYVTVLPRALADWYARRKGHKGYRNYLYSGPGYRRLLHRVGFAQSDVYLAIPSYNNPRFLIPMNGSGFSYYSRNFNTPRAGRLRNLLQSLLVKLRVRKHLEYAFAILARK
jgi:SAM-dependent methyltransferase